jgi:hypothetical protein
MGFLCKQMRVEAGSAASFSAANGKWSRRVHSKSRHLPPLMALKGPLATRSTWAGVPQRPDKLNSHSQRCYSGTMCFFAMAFPDFLSSLCL